jgi:sulfur carrier protein
VNIIVNRESRTVPDGATLLDLARQLDLTAARGVAVAVDGRVVPRSAWPGFHLAAGATVVVIRAAQGG